ncbi:MULTISPECIES: hypothetical protein [unclassified Microcoleus]|uniref:hypothetical protein n=1 Tax=unclassified Microcoleus TaxID=2642155 RepID=UPI0025E5618D|nr:MULTISPECIES: hypothetical protein [unclassified Microcoleus]
MTWITLGTIDVFGEQIWNTTQSPASSQSLIRLTYITGGTIADIKSRLLVRRLWQINGELPIEEQAITVYPSSNRILLTMPILPDHLNSGLATYKIQAKRYFRWRKSMIQEPRYFLQVEAS